MASMPFSFPLWRQTKLLHPLEIKKLELHNLLTLESGEQTTWEP